MFVLEGGFATCEHLTDEAQHPPARRPERGEILTFPDTLTTQGLSLWCFNIVPDRADVPLRTLRAGREEPTHLEIAFYRERERSCLRGVSNHKN